MRNPLLPLAWNGRKMNNAVLVWTYPGETPPLQIPGHYRCRLLSSCARILHRRKGEAIHRFWFRLETEATARARQPARSLTHSKALRWKMALTCGQACYPRPPFPETGQVWVRGKWRAQGLPYQDIRGLLLKSWAGLSPPWALFVTAWCYKVPGTF